MTIIIAYLITAIALTALYSVSKDIGRKHSQGVAGNPQRRKPDFFLTSRESGGGGV